MSKHFVYIVKCSDNSLYTGYAVDVEKRVQAHNSKKGAKYTKSRTPVSLMYYEEYEDKTTALKREYEIKQLKRSEKLKIIKSSNFKSE